MPVHDKPNAEMSKIDQAIEELKARRKQLQSRAVYRTRLLRYCNEQEFTRADLFAVIAMMPKLRITQKDREAKLHTIAEKHRSKANGKFPHAKFGIALRKAREAKGLSTYEVSQQLGVHATSINSWERGKWQVASDLLARLSKIYGVELKGA